VNILGVCSSVFELAILEGAIEHNPVKHIPSRKRPKKRGHLDVDHAGLSRKPLVSGQPGQVAFLS
jgi:hypothetical protein